MELRSLRVAVLQGGSSTEREVSLRSGAAVLRALASGPDAPAELVAVDLERDGAWRVDGARLALGGGLARLAEVDVAFLALHGGAGEDGTLQAALELAGVAYTGSGVAASALAMDKALARALVAPLGVRVARAVELARGDPPGPALDGLPSDSGWVVKPRRGGSSVGVVPVADPAALLPAVAAALAESAAVLVEERIVGVEATCAVLDEGDGRPRTLTPVEIAPADGRWFDYEQKYSADGAREHCPPLHLPAAAQAELRAAALAAHVRLGCAGLTRSDFVVPRAPDGSFGSPVFLELNTLPGLTERSLAPLAAAHDGLSFRELCARLLGAALRRRAAQG